MKNISILVTVLNIGSNIFAVYNFVVFYYLSGPDGEMGPIPGKKTTLICIFLFVLKDYLHKMQYIYNDALFLKILLKLIF